MEQHETIDPKKFSEAVVPVGKTGLKCFIETLCGLLDPDKLERFVEAIKENGPVLSEQAKQSQHSSPTSISPTATTSRSSSVKER